MLELLNQLDGFSSEDRIKVAVVAPGVAKCYLADLFWQVVAATNRIDILDPALLRSGIISLRIYSV